MSEQISANYDTPWKEALQQYFEPFLSFCFPKVHALIDWGQPPESLDKELEQIVRQADSGERIADKLFKVWLQDGKSTWVLVHVEVQSQSDDEFAKRMYQYNYRAFDLYEQQVISLAVLGDKQATWRPGHYGYALGDCEVKLKFPIVKLLDYQAKWQDLEQSTNPFAVMIMAHLTTLMTQGKPPMRQQGKWDVVRKLLEKGYHQEDIRKLFRLVDWMMTLPPELQQNFETQLKRYREERQMPVLSHMELRAILQTARESVLEVLEVRFATVPPELIEAINQIEDASVLKQLLRQAIAISSIAQFQQLLSSDEIEGLGE
ncbi:MAG: transposase [Symploca sp. SIO1B1]|nr:transposase [Symploca sp. SIO1C2]NER94706.1 transposase [Symploca sp. SIO1B1]